MGDQNTIEFKPVKKFEAESMAPSLETPQSANTDLTSEEVVAEIPSVETNPPAEDQKESSIPSVSTNAPVISVGYPISPNGTEPASIVLAKASGKPLPIAV